MTTVPRRRMAIEQAALAAQADLSRPGYRICGSIAAGSRSPSSAARLSCGRQHRPAPASPPNNKGSNIAKHAAAESNPRYHANSRRTLPAATKGHSRKSRSPLYVRVRTTLPGLIRPTTGLKPIRSRSCRDRCWVKPLAPGPKQHVQ